MDTMNTSLSHQYPTNYNAQGQTDESDAFLNSASSSPRSSRFEIFFDQNTSDNKPKLNSPVNARLRYYKYSFSSSSAFEKASLYHSEQTSPVSSPKATIQQLGGSPSQRYPQAQQPPLLRTFSLPSMDRTSMPTQESHPKNNSHSRKSSILSNCTNTSDSPTKERSNSCVSCENSIITMNDSPAPKFHVGKRNSIYEFGTEDRKGTDDICRRHHYRRESIAIKFENPLVIDQEIPQAGDIGDPEDIDDSVFDSLKNYELK